ncbi:hypothetical protein SAMN05421743_10613 [Thalassobacillus cyri]|uniref:VOC domain-containing protein n=1 Tax=Thalassobacillus cyri TaxID=571932 RepID=A0A1H4CDE3_9BACI|nr:ornithine monooxygenase [Thalassobacillus cyri]SEA58319.1 hypothetical protein SAMN05421743_10613 [Thalassobacillus cyri]
MKNTGVTFQVRVSDYEEGVNWYQTLFNRGPDFVPHEEFVEWEVIKDTWLQVAKGTPTVGSGPFRIGVENIEAERERLISVFGIDIETVQTREGVPAAWCTFSDPFGNRIGLYQDFNN